MLQEVARRVSACVPAEGSVARFGGDEFAVLLPTTGSAENALAFADTLRTILSTPVRVGDIVLEIQWSIGIAVAPDDGDQSAVLLRHADVAMYEAKRTKSGVQLYDANLDPNSVERLEFATSLRKAIDHGHIVVYYQPKARLDGTVVGVEALCRWEHETLGLVEPSKFIAVAEHNGLITRLTDYVIDRALRDCALWRAQGRAIGVAINVSPTCLVDIDFPDRFRNLLVKRVVPAERVTLEITESGVLELTRAHAVLAALNEIGVRLSVDDFGTGYSSLSYLHTLPVQEVKIDRSFVLRLGDDEGGTSIVKAIVDLGHTLGLTVVAEGVEDAEGWEQLVALGCDQIQGYFLSRPLPEEDFTTWLQQRDAVVAHG
jgi:predicted signal transduction protein with EAL and GGDEF domain